jgi:hypothetical protein
MTNHTTPCKTLLVLALLSMPPAFAQESESAITSKEDAAAALGSVVSNMKRVANGLKGKQQITAETLTTQSDVLKSLDRLIKLADKLPQNKRRQPSGAQQNGNPNPNQKPQPNQPREEPPQQSQDRRDDQQPQDSTDAVKSGQVTADGPGQRRRIMVQEIWGHLPAAMQRRLMSGSKEKALPKYQQLVEQYFQAIAEKNPTPKRNRRASPAPKSGGKR